MYTYPVLLSALSMLLLCGLSLSACSTNDTPRAEAVTAETGPAAPLTDTTSASPSAAAPLTDATSASHSAVLPTRALRFEHVTLHDPAVNNLESHTLLVPRGWTLQGGPMWTPQVFRSFAHLSLRLTGPDQHAVSVYPGTFYSYVQADILPPQPAGAIDNGTIVMPVPASPDAYVLDIFMPQHRPQARNVRVLQTTERPAMVKALQEMGRVVVEGAYQSDRMMGTQTKFTFIATRVRVAYDEGGQAWEEDLYFEGNIMQIFSREITLGAMVQSTWWISDLVGLRAPAGMLDEARELLETVRMSIQRTPKYAALLSEINARIVRQEADALHRAAQIWIQNQNEILRTHGSTTASMQASTDDAHRAFINSIHEVEDYKTPDGSSVALPAFYDHVYTNNQGDYLLTNDAFFNNADWTPLERMH